MITRGSAVAHDEHCLRARRGLLWCIRMEFSDATIDPRFPPMSRAVWDRMVEAGELDGERIELIRGVVVRMSPLTDLHTLFDLVVRTRADVAARPCVLRDGCRSDRCG